MLDLNDECLSHLKESFADSQCVVTNCYKVTVRLSGM